MVGDIFQFLRSPNLSQVQEYIRIHGYRQISSGLHAKLSENCNDIDCQSETDPGTILVDVYAQEQPCCAQVRTWISLEVSLWLQLEFWPMIPPVRGWTGPDWTSPGLVQCSPRSFWTGIGPVHNSVRPGLDWTGLAWTSPALCRGLGYTSHCIGLLMGEIYLDGTEYTDRTVIISPGVNIQRWVVIKCEDESCFQWYLTMKQCRICKCVWTGPDRARPVQDWQSVVQSSPTFHLDWTWLSPTPDWDRPDWWNHWFWHWPLDMTWTYHWHTEVLECLYCQDRG